MPEQPTTSVTPATGAVAIPTRRRSGLMTGRSPWITIGLVAVLVAIFVLSLTLAPRSSAPEGEAFGGTDSVVTEVLGQHGVTPWFKPLFEPNSSEVESGLFALQAALGAGVLGFALGSLRGRRSERARQLAAPTACDDEASTGQGTTTAPPTTDQSTTHDAPHGR